MSLQVTMRAAALTRAVALGLTVALGLSTGVGSTVAAVTAPPPNAPTSYQLGGSYVPGFDAGIVIRDSTSRPAVGHYNICYVNGFQTQPDRVRWWKKKHPGLLLRKNNRYVVDGVWKEVLLDTSTSRKRKALARVIGSRIDSCAAKGFSAIEFDNLDSYQRSRGRLTKSNSISMAKLLVKRAHARGLAAAQKNASEIGSRGRRIARYDFAIAEECERYRECDAFTQIYGARVIEVEYTDYSRNVFTRACAARGSSISVLLRDRQLRTPDDPAYRDEQC